MKFDHSLELIASAILFIAVAHTFLTSTFQKASHHAIKGSLTEHLLHLLGEVEVVFGLWAGILVLMLIILSDKESAISYVENLNFNEPLFVFAIMIVAATRPIIQLARFLIHQFAKIFPMPSELGIYFSCLVLGPLFGSLMTEPAAMTVTAVILQSRYFSRVSQARFQYLTLAVLFVNISIGGVLTHFAAPPVLMVASRWHWDSAFMFEHFGWKAIIAVVLNASLATAILRKSLLKLKSQELDKTTERVQPVPKSLVVIHLVFLASIIATAHHPVIFIGLLLFFIGLTTLTPLHQSPLKFRESLLVAFFLAGLVVLGGLQSWWIAPTLQNLSLFSLFFGTAALTAITDNAALTYLGAQIEGTSEIFKYALVSGAVVGGGLTVIANAPNPAGFSILQKDFGPKGIEPIKLFLFALGPTIIAGICFWIL